MDLTYFAHCAFRWTSPGGVRVLADPFQNALPESDWFLIPFPAVEAEIALVTHDHFDHNATHGLSRYTTLLRGPGEYRRDDVSVLGVQDVHARYRPPRLKRNTMFVVEIEGLRCCHIGDNRAALPAEVRAALGRVDLLFVTVDDSCHLLSFPEVDRLVESLDPKVVVPMHYYTEGVTTPHSGLRSPDEWLTTQERVRRLGRDTITLREGDLPPRREVWVFESALSAGR